MKKHMTISIEKFLYDQIKSDVKKEIAKDSSERIQTLLMLGYTKEAELNAS